MIVDLFGLKILITLSIFSWSRKINWLTLPFFQDKRRSDKFIIQGFRLLSLSEKWFIYSIGMFKAMIYEWVMLNVLAICELFSSMLLFKVFLLLRLCLTIIEYKLRISYFKKDLRFIVQKCFIRTNDLKSYSLWGRHKIYLCRTGINYSSWGRLKIYVMRQDLIARIGQD